MWKKINEEIQKMITGINTEKLVEIEELLIKLTDEFKKRRIHPMIVYPYLYAEALIIEKFLLKWISKEDIEKIKSTVKLAVEQYLDQLQR